MKTSEILESSKKRISSPDKWIKRESFVDKNGEVIMDAVDAAGKAEKFCSLASVDTTIINKLDVKTNIGYGGSERSKLYRDSEFFLDLASEQLGNMETLKFNDNDYTTHEDVMDMFDGAIILAREAESAE